MSPASFPRPLPPALLAARVVTLRRVGAAALLGAAALIVALVVAAVAPGEWLLVAFGLLFAAPLILWRSGLLESAAPQPPVTGADLIAEVSTMRISLPDHELALAGAVGVYRIGRHSLPGQTADTTAFPQVQA